MILIGLGSNVGVKDAQILKAREILSERVRITGFSRLFRTPPWGNTDQPFFLNAAASLEFEGSARELLTLLLETERQMGRIREEKWGPRLIDLDLLEFRGEEINEEDLTVPHPWYTRRAFVLIPLLDLVPHWVPTGHSQSITELVKALPTADKSGIEPMEPGSSDPLQILK